MIAKILIDMLLFFMIITYIVGVFKARGLPQARDRIVALTFVFILVFYFSAFVLRYYYGVSTPVVDGILNSARSITRYLENLPTFQIGADGDIRDILLSRPFNNAILDSLYYLGVLSYTGYIAAAILAVSIIRSFINFLKGLLNLK